MRALPVRLVHDLGCDPANPREWPDCSQGGEFRAKRDQSAAQRR